MARSIRPVSHTQLASLVLLLVPGTLFGVGLLALPAERPPMLAHVVVIGVAGVLATAAGAADWWYHATGRRVIGPRERRTELIALVCGGGPLFGLMAAASLVDAPLRFVVPVLLVVVVIAALVVHDERRYHARCTRFETALHRVLVGGQTIAFLAWAHWCFVERVASA